MISRDLGDDHGDVVGTAAQIRQVGKQLGCLLRLECGEDTADLLIIDFAGQAIAHLLGLPKEYASALAKDASTLGLAMGVGAKRFERKVQTVLNALGDPNSDEVEMTFDPKVITEVCKQAFDGLIRDGIRSEQEIKKAFVKL